jgi:hypothetical protein
MNTIISQAEEAPELEFVKFKGPERPQKTFFYQRIKHQNFSGYIDEPEDNQTNIIAVTENEAAGLKEDKWRQVGVGNGMAYVRTLQESGVKKGERVTVEKARQIMKDAFNAELEASRGHFQRPILQTYHFMGASPGTQGAEELMQRKQ